MLDPDGNIISFEVAGTGTGSTTAPTLLININPEEMISGDYTDANGATHGFLIGRGAGIKRGRSRRRDDHSSKQRRQPEPESGDRWLLR